MLNDHRNRFEEPVIGRWLTRDPIEYNSMKLKSERTALAILESLFARRSGSKLRVVSRDLFHVLMSTIARHYEAFASHATVSQDSAGLVCGPASMWPAPQELIHVL
jgi:hypothetical protein